MSARLRSLMVAHGALVFLVGMLAGFAFTFVLVPELSMQRAPIPGDVRGWRMAHLEGILNGLLLIAVAAVGDRLRLGARAQQVVAWGLIFTAWGNMIASLIGPLFGGRGLTFGGGVANSLMYVLFLAAVVAVLVAMWLVVVGALRTSSGGREGV
jgi:hypothetical protein